MAAFKAVWAVEVPDIPEYRINILTHAFLTHARRLGGRYLVRAAGHEAQGFW